MEIDIAAIVPVCRKRRCRRPHGGRHQLAIDIRDALNRRGDLSTFVVHLTKDQIGGANARTVLDAIIAQCVLRAVTPMGRAATQGRSARRGSQRVVCFSETPLEQIYSLVADIAGRQVRLVPDGLVFLEARRRVPRPGRRLRLSLHRADENLAWALMDARIDRVFATAEVKRVLSE